MSIPESVKRQSKLADEFFEKTKQDLDNEQPKEPETPDPQNSDSPSEPTPTQPQEPEKEPEQHQEPSDYKAAFEKEAQRYKVLQGMMKKQLGERDGKIKQLEQKVAELDSQKGSGENISVLRDEIAGLKETIASLRSNDNSDKDKSKVNTQNVDVDHIREEYGNDIANAISSMQEVISQQGKMLENYGEQVKPLSERIEQTEKKTQERDRASSQERDLSDLLKSHGIDFYTMNNDDGFNNYLDYRDAKIGKSLRDILENAWNKGNVQQVAEFFIEYNSLVPHQESSTNKPDLNQHVTPPTRGSGDESQTDSPVMWTEQQIEKLYKDLHAAQRTGNRKEVERLSRLEQQMFASSMKRQ